MAIMPENTGPTLSDVEETLLLPLYFRAIESQRPDALLKDENAVALVRQGCFDFTRIGQAPHDEASQVAVILRNRELDRRARDFLARCPDAGVVHLGCGLDSRFERVENGRGEWYDLDLPDVIALRRQYLGGERDRYHLLACSMLDEAWLCAVYPLRPRPFLFLAEGVFMYFSEAQVKSFVLMLQKRFPAAELVFDAFSPFFAWANNRRVARTHFGALCRWSLRRGKDLEGWGDGIQLLDEWFPFQCPEPRLAQIRWARHIPLLAKTIGIYHYRLG
jgi:O-methyltransferase involved in polyketide biosynthesis